MIKKLRSNRGETLTETLAAILILTLSSLVLLTMTVTAVRINRMAGQSDKTFHAEIAAVETQQSPGTGKIEISGYKYDVVLYGTGGGLTAYGLKGAGA